jgi:hypothetical protein
MFEAEVVCGGRRKSLGVRLELGPQTSLALVLGTLCAPRSDQTEQENGVIG